MAKLADALSDALAETFAFYFVAHSAHWNVTGPNFPQLHAFFGDIYEDAHDAVDAIAERIRTLDEPVGLSLEDIVTTAAISTKKAGSNASMVGTLKADNEKVIEALGRAYAAATDANELGLANFLQDRIDKHAKWHWMLQATSKGG